MTTTTQERSRSVVLLSYSEQGDNHYDWIGWTNFITVKEKTLIIWNPNIKLFYTDRQGVIRKWVPKILGDY